MMDSRIGLQSNSFTQDRKSDLNETAERSVNNLHGPPAVALMVPAVMEASKAMLPFWATRVHQFQFQAVLKICSAE
jgi:hypothetical protein